MHIRRQAAHGLVPKMSGAMFCLTALLQGFEAKDEVEVTFNVPADLEHPLVVIPCTSRPEQEGEFR